jgi:hypothetical protein
VSWGANLDPVQQPPYDDEAHLSGDSAPVQVLDSKLRQYFEAHPGYEDAYQDAMKNGQTEFINAYRQEVLNWDDDEEHRRNLPKAY